MRTQYQAFMQYLVQRWETSEACQKPLVGCTPEQVEAIRIAQGVKRLPVLFVETMLAMGKADFTFFKYPDMLSCWRFDPLHSSDILILVSDSDADTILFVDVNEDDPMIRHMTFASPKTIYKQNVEKFGKLSFWFNDIKNRVRDPFKGFTHAEIEAIRVQQGVDRIPPLVVGYLQSMGHNINNLLYFPFEYETLMAQKKDRFPQLDDPNIFVLGEKPDLNAVLYIHVDEDDPIVHQIGYVPVTVDPGFELEARDWEPLSEYLVEVLENTKKEFEIIKQREQEKHR